MNQLPASRYEQLLEIPDHDDFVRGALAQLEFDFRAMALTALSEWERLDIVAPALFHAVASLQRPSWGHWNGVIDACRDARRAVQRTGDAAARERLQAADALNRLLDLWDAPIPENVDFHVLAKLVGARKSKHTVGKLLTFPITVRNRVAHNPPSDWSEYGDALRPLVRALAEGAVPLPELSTQTLPWVAVHDGEPWLFAGVDDAFQVVHQSRSGKLRESAESSPRFVEAMQRILGKEKARDSSLKRWLAQYATEEIKGVMLGDYLVGPPVGEGGFATVHRGVQLGTGRRVAIKILRDELRSSMGERFQREGEYLGRINHRCVVSVLDHGEEPWIAPRTFDLSGESWYREFANSAPVKSFLVMEWIEGRTFEQVFSDPQRPDNDVLCQWMADAADALASVHAAGLIHRDVKPSNIMITDENRIVLADFGIARPREEARTLKTTAGHVLGTPAYMSPEQIRAAEAEDVIGPETDVYSLCATFYELFTGARLFRHDKESSDSVKTRKLAGERPEPPNQIVTGLPWEIKTILMGGLEPEVHDRYQSAREIERDLRHVLRDEPIEYRRPSVWRRSQLFYRRHRWTTNLAGLTLLILVVASVVSTLFGLEAQRQATYAFQQEGLAKSQTRIAEENALLSEWGEFQAQLQKERADRSASEISHQLTLAERTVYSGQVREADTAWRQKDPIAASAALSRTRLDLRGFEYNELRGQLLSGCRLILRGHTSPVNSMAFSPDGRTLASASGSVFGPDLPERRDQTLRLWDLSTGQVVRTLEGHTNGVSGVAFSPDGRTLASASADKTVRLWDASTGQVVHTLEGHTAGVKSVVFSPDGRTVASASADKTVRLWDASTGQIVRTLEGHTDSVNSVAFSPDGRILASGGGVLWDTSTGQVVRTLQGYTHIKSVAFSPDGRTLASGGGGGDHRVRLWDTSTGQVDRMLVGHILPVNSVAFSPDGKTLASAGWDKAVRLWDASTGQVVRTLEGHTDYVSSVVFSPDGRTLASGSDDQTVRLWDASTGQIVRTLEGHTGWVSSVAFSPNGRTLASGSDDHRVRLWDTSTGQVDRMLVGHILPVRSVAFSPDGRTLASGSDDQTVRLWDASTGQIVRTLEGHTGWVSGVAFSPDGRTLASASEDKTVRLWDASTGQVIRTLQGHQSTVKSVAFSPVGLTLASGGSFPDNTVRLWDAATGQVVRTLEGHTDSVNSVAFSPDGKTLVSASGDFHGFGKERLDRTVRMWDVTTGQVVRTLEGHTSIVFSVAFSPDGRTLASASMDKTVRLWDASTGQVVRTLERHTDKVNTDQVNSVAFSPDGKTLASASGDNPVRLWDALTGQVVSSLEGHTSNVTSVAFSQDGKTLASASFDSTVRLWDASTGQVIRTLEGHTNAARCVAFSPGGRTLASGSFDKTIRLWDASTGQVIRTLEGYSVTFSPDGRTLAGVGGDTTVRLWDASTGQVVRTLEGHTGAVTSVVFSPNGHTLASASWDKTVRMWDASTGQVVRTLEGHTAYVHGVAFSPDGRTLASASEDKTVRLWDASTGQVVRTLQGHSGPVKSVAFSPDGRTLASGSFDKTIRSWDALTGQVVHMLQGHASDVDSVAFSPDGSTLASGGGVGDNTVRLWPFDAIDEQIDLMIDRSSRFVAIGDRDGALRPLQQLVTLGYWSPEIEAAFERAKAVPEKDVVPAGASATAPVVPTEPAKSQ
jgi:WD40 repeat protein/serine/threonine protein kinase